MDQTAERTLMSVYWPPEPTQGIVDEYLHPFGFTIYRTDYSSSDQTWNTLLATLNKDFKQEILNTFQKRQHIPEEKEATERILSLVQFDGRSDAALLNDCTIEQLRTIFKQRTGGPAINADDITKQYFLVADGEVLDAASRGTYWVKLAEVEYDEAEHNLGTRFQMNIPQTYFGWMRIATTSLLYTRIWLDGLTLVMLSREPLYGNHNPDIMDETMVVD